MRVKILGKYAVERVGGKQVRSKQYCLHCARGLIFLTFQSSLPFVNFILIRESRNWFRGNESIEEKFESLTTRVPWEFVLYLALT